MKIVDFISRRMALIVLVVAAGSLLWPEAFGVIKTAWISYLLGVVMFGMGLTLNLQDFKIVFSRPKDVIIGCIAQFSIMPLLAWALAKTFQLPPELAVGVVLVGCCPGGTASNVITYLAGGDLALSVGMTGVSTILAPVMTPFLTWLFVGTTVDVNPVAMFMSIVQVVILPIALGLIFKRFFPVATAHASKYLPAFSTLAIAAIVAAVVSANSTNLKTCGFIIILVVILHNLFGFALGYLLGSILRLSHPKRTAISIEVGMQNSGLACSLATQHFASMALAPVPGAIFSVWHNIAGAILAKFYKGSHFFTRAHNKDDQNTL